MKLCSSDKHYTMEPKKVKKVFFKKGVLKNLAKFTGKRLCQSLFFNKGKTLKRKNNFIKKETLAQLFSFEFSEIFKNSFFYRTHPVAASGMRFLLLIWLFRWEVEGVHAEPSQASKMGLFEKIFNRFQPLTVFANRSFLDVWQGPEYTSGYDAVTCDCFQRHTQNPVQHLRWIFWRKKLTAFSGSKYVSCFWSLL